MTPPDRPKPRLPESLTGHLRHPKNAIWPTPGDRHRPQTGPHRPRVPTRAFKGVWLWAIVYNVVGAAILAILWANMGH